MAEISLLEGEVPESKQGKYQSSGVLWSDEGLNKKAARDILCTCCPSFIVN